MANIQPPPTYVLPIIYDENTKQVFFDPNWLKWFIDLAQTLNDAGGVSLSHLALADLQGGTLDEYYHLTSARYTTLTGTQAANVVFAGPTGGAPAIAAFRALVTNDLPAGTGTVTSIAVSSSNGIGVSGSPITTSGTITLSLGDITPTSVAASGSGSFTQSTLGNVVFSLYSIASNDDPNEITYQNKITTTDATVTTIATIPIPASTTVFIETKIVARRTGGAAGTAEDGAAYMVDAVYKNVAGTATEIGETSLFSAEDQAGWDVTVTPSGANALIQVTGAVDNNISWIITYRTYSISS